MPQMAPMSWIMLFSTFIITLIMMMMTNYYLFSPKVTKYSKKMTINPNMNWKW